MGREKEVIRQNLNHYPYISEFLGNVIEQRLGIDCFTHGALTANLLDHHAVSPELVRLDTVLQFGKGCCENFDAIFSENSLSSFQDADDKILDILAEVKAFEFLCAYEFRDIAKIKRKQSASTVDFTAVRHGEKYAIEVTRRRPSKSERKKPLHAGEVNTLSYEDCENAEGMVLTWTLSGLNIQRLEHELYDEVDAKYSQIKRFTESNVGIWKGILFVSGGRDYFITNRFEDREWQNTPRSDFQKALDHVWQYMNDEQRQSFLSHIVITRGRDLKKTIVHPLIQ